jgi:hypothetical protein
VKLRVVHEFASVGSRAGGRVNGSHLVYVFLLLLFAVVNMLQSVITVITSTATRITFWGKNIATYIQILYTL